MSNDKKIKDHIRSMYFKLMTVDNHDNFEDVFSEIVKELNVLFKAAYVGIYIYNDWKKKYQFIVADVVDTCMPTNIETITTYSHKLQQQNTTPYFKGNQFLSASLQAEKSFMINIQSYKGNETYQYLLVIVTKEDIDAEDLLMIKTETETLLNFVYLLRNEVERSQKNEYLYWLSSHLHASTDKHVVLSRIVESLENTFQDYSHCLLLSHDFDVDGDLPIQSIDIGDEETQRNSSTAFITGEVQIQSRLNETRLYAPLLGNQGVYGVIQMISPTIINLKEIEMAFIAQIAQVAGRALEAVTLHEASVHLIADLKMINRVTHQLNSNLEFDELIKILKKELVTISQATEIGFVYYHGNSSANYEILPESTSYFHTNSGHQLIKWLNEKTGKQVEPILSTDFQTEYGDYPYRSLILIPMNRSEFNYGYVVISHEEKSVFTFESFKLMKMLISHSTLALTNTVLKDQLEKAVITDYLTQLYSRNYLDKRLNSHMEKDNMGTFLLFDIDDFKSINDTYGHHIGDKVINQIADVIRGNISSNDFPARWGGEEFAVYLPHNKLEAGIEIAEVIRRKVAKQTNPPVTVSCGISTWSTQYVDSASAIFIRADKALYKAKETGKNRTVTENELWDFIKN